MRYGPIMFSGPMVRAILDRRKTQTRRVVKPQPLIRGSVDCVVEYRGRSYSGPAAYLINEIMPRYGCPYGVPGDQLWVRETWQRGGDFEVSESPHGVDPNRIYYRADQVGAYRITGRPWRPSIFLPRWASRIKLDVARVRVQRLQEISEEDALAEGVFCSGERDGTPLYAWWTPDAETRVSPFQPQGSASAVAAFRSLWESINSKRAPWDSNPWVWAVSFRLAEPRAAS